MPKTKSAFAFRDFDEERILQRRYFSNFGFSAGLTDAEILQSLNVTESDSVDDAERKLTKIKALRERIIKYDAFIFRHFERMSSCEGRRMIREKIYGESKVHDNEEGMSVKYLRVEGSVIELFQKLDALFYNVEKIVQKKYKKDLVDRLKYYQQRSGINRKKLGEMVNVSPQSMYDYWNRRRDIPIYTLIRIAKILGVSADKLLGLE